MKRLLIILLFTAFLTSCSKDSQDLPKYHFEILKLNGASDYPDFYKQNDTISFKITYTLPNSKYSFYKVYLHQNDDNTTDKEIATAIYAYVDDETTATGPAVDGDYTIKLLTEDEDKDFVFKIWKGKDDDNTDIYDTIRIPLETTDTDTAD